MSSITIPDSARALFNEVALRAIIRDTNGTVLGFFAPVNPEPQQGYNQTRQLVDKQLDRDVSGVSAQLALLKAKEPVEMCDEAGEVFGYFAPVTPDRADFVARAFPPPSQFRPEEDPHADFDLAAAERELERKEKGFTLAEVYEHLLSITPEPHWRAHLQENIDRLKE